MIQDYLKIILVLNKKMMESMQNDNKSKSDSQEINGLDNNNVNSTCKTIRSCLDTVSFSLLFILRCVPYRRWYRFGFSNGHGAALALTQIASGSGNGNINDKNVISGELPPQPLVNEARLQSTSVEGGNGPHVHDDEMDSSDQSENEGDCKECENTTGTEIVFC